MCLTNYISKNMSAKKGKGVKGKQKKKNNLGTLSNKIAEPGRTWKLDSGGWCQGHNSQRKTQSREDPFQLTAGTLGATHSGYPSVSQKPTQQTGRREISKDQN